MSYMPCTAVSLNHHCYLVDGHHSVRIQEADSRKRQISSKATMRRGLT